MPWMDARVLPLQRNDLHAHWLGLAPPTWVDVALPVSSSHPHRDESGEGRSSMAVNSLSTRGRHRCISPGQRDGRLDMVLPPDQPRALLQAKLRGLGNREVAVIPARGQTVFPLAIPLGGLATSPDTCLLT